MVIYIFWNSLLGSVSIKLQIIKTLKTYVQCITKNTKRVNSLLESLHDCCLNHYQLWQSILSAMHLSMLGCSLWWCWTHFLNCAGDFLSHTLGLPGGWRMIVYIGSMRWHGCIFHLICWRCARQGGDGIFRIPGRSLRLQRILVEKKSHAQHP